MGKGSFNMSPQVRQGYDKFQKPMGNMAPSAKAPVGNIKNNVGQMRRSGYNAAGGVEAGGGGGQGVYSRLAASTGPRPSGQKMQAANTAIQDTAQHEQMSAGRNWLKKTLDGIGGGKFDVDGLVSGAKKYGPGVLAGLGGTAALGAGVYGAAKHLAPKLVGHGVKGFVKQNPWVIPAAVGAPLAAGMAGGAMTGN